MDEVMLTPEEINDRLLVGYVPTYMLVMVHLAVVETGWDFWLRFIAPVLAGVALFFADKINYFKNYDRWSRMLQASRDGGIVNIAVYWAIVYPGLILAFYSSSYEGTIAVVSVTISGMFSTRELLEKVRLRSLRGIQT